MKEMSEALSKPTKRKKSWSMREEANGISREVRVKEAENGFIISISRYGRDDTKKDSQYIDENKEFISKTNPLEAKEPDEKDEVEFSLKGIDATISDMMGGLII